MSGDDMVAQWAGPGEQPPPRPKIVEPGAKVRRNGTGDWGREATVLTVTNGVAEVQFKDDARKQSIPADDLEVVSAPYYDVEDRCIGHVFVDRERRELWTRREAHPSGTWNGDDGKWWVKMERDGEHWWLPFLLHHDSRSVWSITFDGYQSTKHKWDEVRINHGVSVRMKLNGIDVFEFGCRDMDYALAKAQTLIVQLAEHSFRFHEPDEMIGQKVYYRDQPAVVERLILEQGAVILRYDGPEQEMPSSTDPDTGTMKLAGFNFWRPHYRKGDDWVLNGGHGEKTIKADIMGDNIYWHRQ